jgi:hypothetical protein
MMRWVLFIAALACVYFADIMFFHGDLTRETSRFARDVGHELNQQVSDLIRPLRR